MMRGDRTFRLVIDHLGSVRRVVDTFGGEQLKEIWISVADFISFLDTLADACAMIVDKLGSPIPGSTPSEAIR